MPYTPPAKRSPASSSPQSPALTRTHSYDQHASSPSRPELPRSRSAVYLQKHRRSPSLASNQNEQAPNQISQANGAVYVITDPSLLSDKSLLSSAYVVASPEQVASPDENDEERGRRLQIQDLKKSLQDSMALPKRRLSPTRAGQLVVTDAPPKADVKGLKLVAPALTPEALKIAHSRSSSEIPILPSSQSAQTSSGDSDEDGLEMKRIPMVRKKSGELVKPALRGNSKPRPISAPGTPTHPKAVHFNDNIEQVRHFLQVDRPMAVSAGSSPVETYDSESDYPFSSDDNSKRVVGWEIRLGNFPKDSYERQTQAVRLEKLSLSKDNKTLLGLVAVANIAFSKWVTARFTLDYWKTTSEVGAEFYNLATQAQKADGYDRFQFSIKLSEQANLQNKTMYLCVRYNVSGQEHWDSNAGNNYQIDFVRKLITKQVSKAPPGALPIPRSRHTSNGARLPRPKSFPAGISDDEFSTSVNSPFRLPPTTGNPVPPSASQHDHHHASSNSRLSNRYDFGASLSAALTSAQLTLGDRSGLKLKHSHAKPPSPQSDPAQVAAETSQPLPANADPNLHRPDLNSAEYKDLIKKFCYFGSGGNTTVASPDAHQSEEPAKGLNIIQVERVSSQTNEEGLRDSIPQLDMSSGSNESTPTSSASNSPPTPKAQLHQLHLSPEATAPSVNQSTDSLSVSSAASSARSTPMRTVSPRLLPYRSPSPALNSAYQEFAHQGLSIQSAQC